jgi:hypothetical protein
VRTTLDLNEDLIRKASVLKKIQEKTALGKAHAPLFTIDRNLEKIAQ